MASNIVKRKDGLYQISFVSYGFDIHKSRKKYEDAVSLSRELDVDFYKNNRDKLPKGIVYVKANTNFPFILRVVNLDLNAGSVQIKSYETAAFAISGRKRLIKSLIDI